MIDFHCHIITPSAHMPDADGDYYHTLKPLATSGAWMDKLLAESVEAVAENWRSGPVLRGYRQMSPLIYSEMVRRMTQTDSKRLIQEMKQQDVRLAVVVAIDPYIPTDEIIAACDESGGKLLPFGSIDPWTKDWNDRLIETLAKPIAGFKFHSNLQQLQFRDPRMYEILTVMVEQGFTRPIFVHSGDYPIYKEVQPVEDWVIELEQVVTKFPSLKFVCGHCGWNRYLDVGQIALRNQNLWLETSWQPPRVLRQLCDLLGPHRFVLGSDYPLYSMRRAIRNLRIALTNEEFEIISEEVPSMLLNHSSIELTADKQNA